MQVPLYRNGYALIFSSFATSGLGILYWVVAARLYSPEIVGINSAIISVMFFLGNVAHLNMVAGLNRFLPTAGRFAGRMILNSYLASAAVAAVLALIYVLGVNIWSPSLAVLQSSPVVLGWFVAAAVAWVVFVLQDSALTGLRKATVIPIENTAFAVGKLVLLVAFSWLTPELGIIVSWTVTIMLTVVPTNIYIFRKILPDHVRNTLHVARRVEPREIVRFVAGDYVASLLSTAVSTTIPLIIIERLGAETNAYFYLANTIAYALYLISTNMGMSLLTEASLNERSLERYSYQAAAQSLRLVLIFAAGLVVLAGPLLHLFGEVYSDEATGVFRLLVLSAIPNVFIMIYLAVARVRRRIRSLIFWRALQSGLIVGLSLALLGDYGLLGVGWAFLIGQSIPAALLLAGPLRKMWTPFLYTWGLRNLYRGGRRAQTERLLVTRVDQARRLLPRILPEITPGPETTPPSTWVLGDLVQTESDIAVMALGPAYASPATFLKLSQTEGAAKRLIHQVYVLTQLRNDPRLNGWLQNLPAIRAEGVLDGHFYVVEQALGGITAREAIESGVSTELIQGLALDAISQLHTRTAESHFVNADLLMQWVDDPIDVIRGFYNACRRNVPLDESLDRLAVRLRSSLAGATLMLSWIHGDLAPQHVMIEPDGSKLYGFVDWDRAAPRRIPHLDLIQWILVTRMIVRRRELGYVVRELIDEANWTPNEQALLTMAHNRLGGDPIETRTLVLLCWLHHVSTTLNRWPASSQGWLWLVQNVEGVLQAV